MEIALIKRLAFYLDKDIFIVRKRYNTMYDIITSDVMIFYRMGEDKRAYYSLPAGDLSICRGDTGKNGPIFLIHNDKGVKYCPLLPVARFLLSLLALLYLVARTLISTFLSL